MLPLISFFYLRHGETDWNRAGRMQGWTDVPLNATGLAQARAAAALVRGLGIRTICASPLARARETARIVAEAIECRIELIDDLRECGFGAREGDLMGPWFEAWQAGRGTPEGGEPYREFLARAMRGICRALEAEGPVLIVAHGAVYWAIRDHARFDPSMRIGNCQPIRHDPPGPERAGWAHSLLSAVEAAPQSA